MMNYLYMFWFVLPIMFIIIIIGVIIFFSNRSRNTSNNVDPNQMKPKTTAGDFLLNIGAIIILYTIVSSLLNLLFTITEIAYPQINNDYYYYPNSSHSISWPVSILIILFPIFVSIMYFLEKSYAQNPEKRNIGIHKGLTYITLSIGSIILIGDLITVIYYFIDGQELTTGFLLKIFSVLVVTLVVFLYYIADIRNTLTLSKRKIWLSVSVLIVVASIVWGFSVLGSPRTQQLLKYDQQKTNDLQSVKSEVENYYRNKGILPGTLTDLSDSYYYYKTKDQQTGKLYEYTKKSDRNYELCAEFNKDSKDMDKTSPGLGIRKSLYDNSWSHPAGRYCFKQVINFDLNVNSIYYNQERPLPAVSF